MDEAQHWRRWQTLFASRAGRELPALDPLDETLRERVLAASLAQFQRREAKECRCRNDFRYLAAGRDGQPMERSTAARAAAAAALRDENRRHSHLLAIAVRLLGGEPERPNSFPRPRSKTVVARRLVTWQALAADVACTAYYMSVAASLPVGRVQSWLAEIAEEKRTHVEFRSRVAHLSAGSLRPAWLLRGALAVSAASVLLSQRRLFRTLGISAGSYWGRCLALADLAEKLVSGAAEPRQPAFVHAAANGLV